MKRLSAPLLLLCGCLLSGAEPAPSSLPPFHPSVATADTQATPATKKLYQFLSTIHDQYTIMGHQDDLAYGNGWRYQDQNPNNYVSDFFNTCGDYPGVFGWDLGQLERKVKYPSTNYLINGILIEDLKKWAVQVHAMGGINFFSWHANNPVTGGDSWDNGDGTVVCQVLDKSSPVHQTFNQYLDLLADFFHSLKDANNQPIPVLFRPFHEANMNNCFWWNFFDSKTCSHEQYRELFRYIKNYLTLKKGVHNLLYVFSLNDNCMGTHNNEATLNVENEYPGDNYVDIVGYDLYMKNEFLQTRNLASLANHAVSHNKFVAQFAQSHNKVPAITEAGWENYPELPGAFTQLFANNFGDHGFSFVLLWRNPDRIRDFTSYYSIYPAHPNAKDFQQFHATTQRFLFRKELDELWKNFNKTP